MNILDIAHKIEDKIKLLENMRCSIKDRATRKALSISEYDRKMATTIIQLKNGIEMELDGHKIQNPVNTIIDKIARGICYKEKLEMEEADGMYKSIISNIDSVQAEMNGLQSVNRYLDKT